jgi:predicted aspartyl protease
MSRGAQSFKQGDVIKAVKAVVKAGVQVGRVEIGGGKIIVIAESAKKTENPDTGQTNEWDAV